MLSRRRHRRLLIRRHSGGHRVNASGLMLYVLMTDAHYAVSPMAAGTVRGIVQAYRALHLCVRCTMTSRAAARRQR